MEKKKDFPKLRFPEFKEVWEEIQLGMICSEISYGLTVRPEYIDEGIPLISAREISKGVIDFENAPRISFKNFTDLSNKAKPIKGDLFLSKTGSVGFSAYVDKDKTFAITQNIAVIRLKEQEKYLPHYFLQFFKTNLFLKAILSRVNQSTIMDLQLQDIKKLKIPISKYNEQQKIASFLTTVDQKLTQLKQKKTLLEQYKKGVMQKLFNASELGLEGLQDDRMNANKNNEILKSSNPKNPNSDRLRFKDENGKEFPKWEDKKLGEIARFLKGKGISKNDIVENGETECIRYGELYTHYHEVISEIKSKTNIDEKDLIFSEANDVIIPASGETQIDIATASCVMKSGIALGGDLNIIRTDNNGIFLSYYLNNKKKLDIACLSQGISVVHLYSSQLALLNLEIPCHAEQIKIANFLSAIDEKINHCQAQIEKTEHWKKGLLQQMFV